MAFDLEAIRKRVNQLSGIRTTSSVQLWKPGPGEYKVRGLPWKNAPDGQPFIEKWFYYIGTNPGILTPHQFGKPDPINDLVRKLYSSGNQDDRNMARKLQAKMRAYMPVIVRGEESKGVQVWSFGKQIYSKLLGYYLDEEVGDILDPNEGFDLKVTITKLPGKQFNDTVVDAARKATRLADADQAKSWLDAVPNLDDMYSQKSFQEVETILNNWLNAGDSNGSSDDDDSDGTSHTSAAVSDELDKLVNEVKSSKPAKAKAKKVADDEDDDAPSNKKNLDDAFAELMSDDE